MRRWIGVPPVEKKGYKPLEAARILGIAKESLLALERDGSIPSADRDEYGNRFYTAEQVEAVRDVVGVRPVIDNPPRVLAVFNMKGGVGKSTISANLAVTMAEKGVRVLALDADPQGHLTTSLGEEPSSFPQTLMQMLIPDRQGDAIAVTEARKEITPNLHLVPANLSMCAMNLLLFQQPEREYRLRPRGRGDTRNKRLRFGNRGFSTFVRHHEPQYPAQHGSGVGPGETRRKLVLWTRIPI